MGHLMSNFYANANANALPPTPTKAKAKKRKRKTTNTPQPLTPVKPMTGFKKWLKRLFLGLVALFVAFHLMVLALLLIWQTQPINNSMFMILHRISTFSGVKQTWVDDSQISVNVKRAVIASEDANFANHQGFDVQGIENAIKKIKKQAKYPQVAQPLANNLPKIYFCFRNAPISEKAKKRLLR